VGSLERTLMHHIIGKIDPECAIICSDARAIESEWFVGEAILRICCLRNLVEGTFEGLFPIDWSI